MLDEQAWFSQELGFPREMGGSFHIWSMVSPIKIKMGWEQGREADPLVPWRGSCLDRMAHFRNGVGLSFGHSLTLFVLI